MTIEKILTDKNKLNEYLLIEDITHLNIFETASEEGDTKIFEILSKYLENNEQLLSSLISQEKNNIFHISAREGNIISLLFFYDFYKNNSSVLNCKNKSTWTPLMTACYKGNYEYVQILINLGAEKKEKIKEKEMLPEEEVMIDCEKILSLFKTQVPKQDLLAQTEQSLSFYKLKIKFQNNQNKNSKNVKRTLKKSNTERLLSVSKLEEDKPKELYIKKPYFSCLNYESKI